MEIGIYTFAERSPDPVTGEVIDHAQRLHNLMDEVRGFLGSVSTAQGGFGQMLGGLVGGLISTLGGEP